MSKPTRQANTASTVKPGPKLQVLEPFNGTFEQAIDKAIGKKKPAGGWPQ